MHNYRCDQICRVLRTSPRGKCFPSCLLSQGHSPFSTPNDQRKSPVRSPDPKGGEMASASRWHESQSHTAKKSARRDKERVCQCCKLIHFMVIKKDAEGYAVN